MMTSEVLNLSQKTSLLFIDQWMKLFPWLVAGFTTRQGGYSREPFESFNLGLHVGDEKEDVLRNRQKLAQMLQFSLNEVTCAEQTHSANVYEVQPQDRGKGSDSLQTVIQNVDGLYTKQKNTLLMSFYADCVPLYFVDGMNQLVGLAHAGWKGTVHRIGPHIVQQWVERYQSDHRHIYVVVGPSICQHCYEVDEHVLQHIRPYKHIVSEQTIIPKTNGKSELDLKQLNVDLLIEAGIPRQNIEISKWCTSCHNDLFFSHRKENGQTGRLASFIAIREEAT